MQNQRAFIEEDHDIDKPATAGDKAVAAAAAAAAAPALEAPCEALVPRLPPPFGRRAFDVGVRLGRLAAQSLAELAPPSVLVRRVAVSDRSIALTFDDGPDENTPALLDVLERYRLGATFFLLGENAERFPEHVAAIAERGHQIASHGYSHRSLAEMSLREIADDLDRTSQLLSPYLGPPGTRLFRPPRGVTTMRAIAWTAGLGYSTVLWSFDSLDWQHGERDALARRFAPGVLEPGEIVLLHEGEAHTREALPAIARMLARERLVSIPLAAMFNRRLPAGEALGQVIRRPFERAGRTPQR